MRKLYQSSPANRKIKMCAIWVALHAYSKRDYEELVFVFGGYMPEVFARLRKFAPPEELDPYISFMSNGRLSEDGDAVSAYASAPAPAALRRCAWPLSAKTRSARPLASPWFPC